MSGAKTYNREIGDLSAHITTATTTAVKSGSGIIKRLIIGTTAAGAITINDSLGTKLQFKASMPEGVYELNILCSGKIEVVTAAASNITVTYE